MQACMYVHVSVYQKEITCRFRLLIFLKAYCHQFALNHLCRRQINTHCIIYKVVVCNFYTIDTKCVFINIADMSLLRHPFALAIFFPYICALTLSNVAQWVRNDSTIQSIWLSLSQKFKDWRIEERGMLFKSDFSTHYPESPVCRVTKVLLSVQFRALGK